MDANWEKELDTIVAPPPLSLPRTYVDLLQQLIDHRDASLHARGGDDAAVEGAGAGQARTSVPDAESNAGSDAGSEADGDDFAPGDAATHGDPFVAHNDGTDDMLDMLAGVQLSFRDGRVLNPVYCMRAASLAQHQVEVMFVLCSLMNGRRRAEVQDCLWQAGIGPVLATLLAAEEWDPSKEPPPPVVSTLTVQQQRAATPHAPAVPHAPATHAAPLARPRL